MIAINSYHILQDLRSLSPPDPRFSRPFLLATALQRALYDGPVSDSVRQGVTDLAEDAQRLLQEIDREVPGAASVSADCRPPVDVLETANSLEVVMDVPGVLPDSLRVVIRRDTLLIVGAKLTTAPDPRARYHLAERSYGRFARAVRLSGAFDAGRARATISQGQLQIALPRLDDRRGRVLAIPVERA
jgi:HSP20 family protein